MGTSTLRLRTRFSGAVSVALGYGSGMISDEASSVFEKVP